MNEDGELVVGRTTGHPFSGIVSEKDKSEVAVVTGVYLKFIQNDFRLDNLEIYLESVFKPADHKKFDEKTIDTGTITIPCFPLKHGLVDDVDELIYKPGLPIATLHQYAGLEDRIFATNVGEYDMEEHEDDTVVVDNTGLYEEAHPLVHFILNRTDFKVQKSEFKKKMINEETFYEIDLLLIERIKAYFGMGIFQHIHYTRFDETKVSTNLKELKVDDKGVVAIVQINYIVVNKNVV